LAALKRQYWRPAAIPYPKENPYGRAKEELGRALFFDPILSGARVLELEITESVLLQADRNVLDALHQFRDLGVRICMDDFGTGYSSLSYLRSFPFDKIKIDRSFIRELGKDNDCMAIIRAVMRLGSSLGMITTAEGVETEEQLEILRTEGCMQVQGFLFSKAVPAAEIPFLLPRLQPRIRAA
jgi:EAL domain-containing protein (putative c-di-GMP-specific phosphodiesterase class I)